jgi:uncharacterized protein DUF5655
MSQDDFSVQSHFEGKAPVIHQIYDQLLKTLKQLGPVIEEPKKTSIHLVNATALAGVATRSDYLILTIKSDHKLTSPRVHKMEQPSAKRFHSEIKLKSPIDIDAELIGWLKDAYALSA